MVALPTNEAVAAKEAAAKTEEEGGVTLEKLIAVEKASTAEETSAAEKAAREEVAAKAAGQRRTQASHVEVVAVKSRGLPKQVVEPQDQQEVALALDHPFQKPANLPLDLAFAASLHYCSSSDGLTGRSHHSSQGVSTSQAWSNHPTSTHE